VGRSGDRYIWTRWAEGKYLEFLYEAMPEIKVENGVVKRRSDISLLLGTMNKVTSRKVMSK
jgi:hypothetical protein